jgi:hypothetical protein
MLVDILTAGARFAKLRFVKVYACLALPSFWSRYDPFGPCYTRPALR